jgi:hypothetical protein
MKPLNCSAGYKRPIDSQPGVTKAQASIDEPLAAQAAVLVGSMRRAAVAMAMAMAMAMVPYAVSVPGAVSVMPVTVLLA